MWVGCDEMILGMDGNDTYAMLDGGKKAVEWDGGMAEVDEIGA